MRTMKVMVCVDGSKHGEKAVRFASRFVKIFDINELTLLHVIPDAVSHAEVPSGYRARKEAAEALMASAKEIAEGVTVEEKAGEKVTYDERIACGPISSEIVRIAETEDFHLIVIGTRGLGGIKRMLTGSVADDVIHHAHCPVTVVR